MKILFADALPEFYIDILRQRGDECVVEPDISAEDLPNALEGIDVLVVRSTKVTAEAIASSDQLSLIVRSGAGTNTIDCQAAADAGIYVCNVPGTNSVAVAELTLGLLLAIDRHIADCVVDLRNGQWNKKKYSEADGLLGKTLGIIGVGEIGLAVAERARSFGMSVIAVRNPNRRVDIESRIRSVGIRLVWLVELIFEKRGGLKLWPAIILALLIGLISVATKGKAKNAVAQYREQEISQKKKTSVVLFGIVAALGIVLPIFMGTYVNSLLANVGIFLLLALGLNIVVGLAGILDLGYVAFFAVGAYTTAVLTSELSPFFAPGMTWVLSLVFVIILAALTGLFIGAPVIRMRGDYLAIVTLGFGEIIRLLFLSDFLKPYFGGAQGILGVPGIDLGVVYISGTDTRGIFYLVLFFCAIAVYVSWRLQASRLGRSWMAIREDEQVAEAMGINTVNSKLMAFVVGAVLASFAGAIMAARVGSVFPNSFMILISIVILVVVIVGGMGSIPGVFVGAFVLIGVLGGPKQPGLLQEFGSLKLLVYGMLLVYMMLQKPEGLVPSARRTQELHQEEFLQDAWLKGTDDEDEEQTAAGEEAQI